MQFKDIIGQDTLKKELPELMQDNRMAHALLFLGKEGSGALSLAIALAQYVVCEKVSRQSTVGSQQLRSSLFGEEPETSILKPQTDSCGTCPSCIKAQQLVHPDIHFSYPVVTKKSGTPPLSTDYIS